MKSLQDLPGVLEVYDFDDGNCSYTMQLAEMTLDDYLVLRFKCYYSLNFQEGFALSIRMISFITMISLQGDFTFSVRERATLTLNLLSMLGVRPSLKRHGQQRGVI